MSDRVVVLRDDDGLRFLADACAALADALNQVRVARAADVDLVGVYAEVVVAYSRLVRRRLDEAAPARVNILEHLEDLSARRAWVRSHCRCLMSLIGSTANSPGNRSASDLPGHGGGARHQEVSRPGWPPDRGPRYPIDRPAGLVVCDRSVLEPQVALLVNERTFLPILMPFAPAATFLERLPRVLHKILRAHQLSGAFIDMELKEMGNLHLAKTTRRRVLGTMNEFAFLADVRRSAGRSEGQHLTLFIELAHTPCGPLSATHVFPTGPSTLSLTTHGRDHSGANALRCAGENVGARARRAAGPCVVGRGHWVSYDTAPT